MTTYQYNPENELTTETWYADAADADAGQNVKDTFHYTYNSAGLMTSESDNTSSDTYAYDPEGRLVTATQCATRSDCLSPTAIRPFLIPHLSALVHGAHRRHAQLLGHLPVQRPGPAQPGRPQRPVGGDAVDDVEVDLTYNAAGQLATIDRYQGGQFVAESVYTYDSLGRLVSLVDSRAARSWPATPTPMPPTAGSARL